MNIKNVVSDKKVKRKIILIILGMYSAFFVIGSVLAPVLAYLKMYEYSANLTYLFSHSCHQQPLKSFCFFGYPVALCCRCFGVYVGTSIFAFLNVFKDVKFNKLFIILMIMLTVVDMSINYIFKYSTGLYPRFISGISSGILIVIGIVFIFDVIEKRRSDEKN